MEVIVAYYNTLAFKDVLNSLRENITDLQITIYNKSGKECVIDAAKTVNIDNVGREGETYLTHIIMNYDSLNDYTLFIQDDTNNHTPDINNFTCFVKNTLCDKKLFNMYACKWKPDIPPTFRTIYNGILELHPIPTNDAIASTCRKFGIHVPPHYTTETCAFFVASKEIIRKRSKEFYIELRKWLIEDRRNEYVLEHMWKIIFV